MSEQLCLKWNDFQENVNTAFGNLRHNNDFCDVTLACEDGNQFETHKVILANSSPFFNSLLKKNKHTHPLIYMKGIKSEDLSAVIDFLYCGEANIFQENLDSFLAIAEELKLRGLMGKTEASEEQSDASSIQSKMKPNVKADQKYFKSVCTDQQLANVNDSFNRILSVPTYGSGDIQEIDEKVKSLMESSKSIIQNGKMQTTKAKICKVCGKEGAPSAIRDHIEANHLEGVSLPCNICEKTFRSRVTLRKHNCKNKIDMIN